jgi:hypothetical protein
MERAYLKSAAGNEWVVSFSDKFAMDSVQRSQPFIQETVNRIAGRHIILRYIQEARAAKDTSEPEVIVSPVAEEQLAKARKDENVQKILNVFKGKIRLPEESE